MSSSSRKVRPSSGYARSVASKQSSEYFKLNNARDSRVQWQNKKQYQLHLDDKDVSRVLYESQEISPKCALDEPKASHHSQSLCVCDACNCGRHLCSIHTVAPPTMSLGQSRYKTDFNKKSSSARKAPKVKFESTMKPVSRVEAKSMYENEFPQKHSARQSQIKYSDSLKFDGPTTGVTSYGEKFPGYSGDSPHIKQKPDPFRGGLKLEGRSTYRERFDDPNKSLYGRPEMIKPVNNLHVSGSSWFGKSSYKDTFKPPVNPEDCRPQSVKAKNRYSPMASSSTQFNTSYKQHFDSPLFHLTNSQCPAKALLQSKMVSTARSKSAFKDDLNDDRLKVSSLFKAK